MISPNHCQNCIGSLGIRTLKCNDYKVSSGDVCAITHQAIRDNEIDAGCESYYDTGARAYLVDVYMDIEYSDRNGKRMRFVREKERVIRVRDMPESCNDWTDIYWESMKQLSKKTELPMNNEGKWISTNIYRCRPRKESEDYKNGIRTITVSFTTSVTIHPEGLGGI